MSDHHRRPLLQLQPRRSRLLLLLLTLSHLLAAAAALAVPLDPSLLTALLILVTASLAYRVWGSILGQAPWSLREARWSERGWRLQFRNGRCLDATLLPSTLVTTRLVLLNFRVHWLRYHSLLLTNEVVEPEQLRRLRARLRLERASV
ncbi:MAG: hypothetical protein GVY22_10130 [Gammaproteobacteria bacterium]|jgi:toxin CptA|nr:hypothetical protein [Gammaproteobacteria bacterium]